MHWSKKSLAFVTFAVWIGASATAFWSFQFKHLGSFENNLATFDGKDLAQLQLVPDNGRDAVVVHFIDPDCPCTRFSLPHISDLEHKLAGHIDFRPATTLANATFTIPATPAVAIWSKSGELAYFGPYSGGDICGSGDDFVTSVVNQLQAGTNPKWFNLDAVGCFCPHAKTAKVTSV